jgi:L-amino acid N-acyltransferase YncA
VAGRAAVRVGYARGGARLAITSRPMLIRHADPARDAAACATLYAPYVSDTVISLEDSPPAAAEFAQRIEQSSATHPWLVAEIENEVAGFAYGSAHRARASYRWATDVSVYIASAHHRMGIGTTLYRELFGLLVRQGFRVACAGVTLPNEASVAIHESFGFELVGIYRHIGWKHGAWRDVGWWQVDLAPDATDPPAEPGPPVSLLSQ